MKTQPAQSGPTSFAAIDDAIADLQRNKTRWASLPIQDRIATLHDVCARIPDVASDWVAAAVKAKGIAHAPALAGEEWMSGPWALLRSVKQLIATLEDIANGKPAVSSLPTRTTTSGQTVVQVFPRSLFDTILLNGVRAEVWMEPGVPAGAVASYTASSYAPQRHAGDAAKGKVGLVLGAGNIASIAPLDTLYKLYTDLSVVILKLNPINDYLGPYVEEIFVQLMRDGFVRIAYGGAEVGAYLTSHPDIDTLHVTGSIVTHDAIVFGAQRQEGKLRTRINHKPITSELGGVSPVIVVPGPWTQADIDFQAKNIATQRLHNGGFNCIASQVLVLPEGWVHTSGVKQAVMRAMSEAPDRPAYYPGAEQRKQRFKQQYRETAQNVYEPLAQDHILVDLDSQATQGDQFMFHEEAFAPVLGMPHLRYDGEGSELAFLRQAIDFANDRLAGTLGANILIHPKTLAQLGAQFEVELARLRYGCIAVNLWTAVGFLLTETSWGAYPGHSIDDVQSGIGLVHNTLMFDRAQKSVIYGPFHPFPRSFLAGQHGLLPTPPWFVSHRSAHKVGQRLFAFEVKPSWLKIPGVVYHALRD